MEHIFNKHNIHILRQQILENQIVFTNGCFDLLHPGHIQYLDQAKKLGEILVVGLNSDQSVKRLKGPQRPINNQEFRATMLLGLKSVDYVIIFDEDTPIQTIQRLRPAIHVKGGDYSAEDLPEYSVVSELGGRIEILSFLEGYSSSHLIKKIKSIQMD